MTTTVPDERRHAHRPYTHETAAPMMGRLFYPSLWLPGQIGRVGRDRHERGGVGQVRGQTHTPVTTSVNVDDTVHATRLIDHNMAVNDSRFASVGTGPVLTDRQTLSIVPGLAFRRLDTVQMRFLQSPAGLWYGTNRPVPDGALHAQPAYRQC